MMKFFEKVHWVAVDCLTGEFSKLGQLPFEIGSGEGADLRLNGQGVAERHCAINQIKGHGLCLIKQEPNLPLIVDGQAVEYCALSPDVDYTVRIGNHFLAIRGGRDVENWLRGLDCSQWSLYDATTSQVDGPMSFDDLCRLAKAIATSNSVTPDTAPDPPTGVTATPGSASATVSWSAPANNGGVSISSYTVTASAQDAGTLTTGTTAVVSGLPPDMPYTFTVVATNGAGTSVPSAPSNAVVPFGAPAFATSGLAALPPNAFASGDNPILLRAFVRDDAGVPVSGQAVGLTSTQPSDLLTLDAGTTNAAGVFESSVTGTVVGARTFTATVGTTILSTSASFIAPCTTATSFALQSTTVAVGASTKDIFGGYFSVDGGFFSLATVNGFGENLSVAPGNGDGTFGTATNYGFPLLEYSNPGAPWSVVTGDFNGDGTDSSAVFILLGNGDGTFQAASSFPVWQYNPAQYPNFFPSALALGDVNGDGVTDVVTAQSFATPISTVLGDGDGGLGPAIFSNVGMPAPGNAYPNALVLADLNGDGKLDLVEASSNAQVGVLLGNGDATFQSPSVYDAGSVPSGIVVGDFNGDGKPDFAVTEDANPAVVQIYLNVCR